MMKYRMLTDDELTHLESDLIAFLIVNGVHAEEWKKINEEEPQKARDLVALFSDQVFDVIYEKIQFVEHRSSESCLVFAFHTNEQELIAIQRKKDSNIDLSTPESIHDALNNHIGSLDIFTSKKHYSSERNIEMHQILENGGVISDVQFWNALKQLITK